MKINGRIALVTGANRGVGAALVESLFARGAKSVYACARNPQYLVAASERHLGRLIPVRLDVTNPADITAAVHSCPDVDLLISNAGIAPFGAVLDAPDEEIRQVFETNVFGPLALVRAFAPGLRERNGGVLFLNSLTGLIVSRSAPVYGASKAAMRMLALGIREGLKPEGVVVTTSHPGFIDTDMAADVPYPKATPQQVADRSLDAWEAEETVVFPDAFAELVESALSGRMPEILREPQQVMTGLVSDLAQAASR